MMIKYIVLRLFFGSGLLWLLIMPEARPRMAAQHNRRAPPGNLRAAG